MSTVSTDRITLDQIAFENASYLDPAGRVFYWENKIFRGFYSKSSSFYRSLLESESVKKRMSNGDLIQTQIRDDLKVDGFDLVVQHEKIPNISYCYEWSDNMLKDAAVLILNLCIEMERQGVMIQDASSFNVLFSSARPIFIDLGAFTKNDSRITWSAYQQFCRFFLFPLYLYASEYHDIARKLMLGLNTGVSYSDLEKILKFWQKCLLPGYFSGAAALQVAYRLIKNPIDRKKILGFFEKTNDYIPIKKDLNSSYFRLLKKVEKIKINDPQSAWVTYYEDTNEDVLKKKLSAVEQLLRDKRPESVVDVGCNTGAYSLMAAREGARVVAFDLDHDCVSRLYDLAKKENLDILPLVMNFLNPSPAQGWQGIEISPAQTRFKSDMVFALALIHHAVFLGEQTFSRVIQSLKSFQKKWLVVEYVDQSEKMIQLMPKRKGVDYSWYTLDEFIKVLGSFYSEVKIVEHFSDTRKLILAEV